MVERTRERFGIFEALQRAQGDAKCVTEIPGDKNKEVRGQQNKFKMC